MVFFAPHQATRLGVGWGFFVVSLVERRLLRLNPALFTRPFRLLSDKSGAKNVLRSRALFASHALPYIFGPFLVIHFTVPCYSSDSLCYTSLYPFFCYFLVCNVNILLWFRGWNGEVTFGAGHWKCTGRAGTFVRFRARRMGWSRVFHWWYACTEMRTYRVMNTFVSLSSFLSTFSGISLP